MEEEIFAPAPTGEGAESLTGSGGYSAGAENLAGPDGTELEGSRESLPQESAEAEGRGRMLPPQGVEAGVPPRRGLTQGAVDYGSRLDEIRRLDPSVTGWGDIAAADTDRAYYRLVFEKGLDEVSAYKAVFFDRLLKGRAEAARQQALNEARSKTHLAPVGGGEGRGTEMTAAELEEWAAYGFGPAEARRYKTRFEKER